MQKLQRQSFSYFLHETNPVNGLVIDKTAPDWPASIAATGLALAAYPVAVERGFMSRAVAGERALKTLRFFWNSPQGPEPMRPATTGFITISSTCGPGGVSGSVNYRLWIALFCWPAH